MTMQLTAPVIERPALTFAHLLTNKPDFDEAARLMVALLCWPIGADGCFIVQSSDSGYCTLGSYLHQPASDGALKPVIAKVAQAAAAALPAIWTDQDAPVAAWSVASDTEVVLLLGEPLAPPIVEERAVDLVDILAVYVAGVLAAADGRNRSRPLRQVTSAPDLSERQLQTLRLLEQNFTMRQIASRIGFSESTVRMESLAIYRALGVHDRRGAVSTGRTLGLLGPDGEAASFEHN